jgi:hypothetical protein
MAGFLADFGPDFSPLRPRNQPLFIGGRRSNLVYIGKKIEALDLVGKDPNRRFKVGILSCQICRKKLPELACLGWHRGCRAVIQPEKFT